MANCFSCGSSFGSGVTGILQYYKHLYETTGLERYFYRLSSDGDVFIVTKSEFKSIFEEDIKPNFHNGAEYAHISEYGKSNIY